MSDAAKHTRQMTVTWADPALLQGVEKKMPWIDILRGMALFGILAANMRGFSAPYVPG